MCVAKWGEWEEEIFESSRAANDNNRVAIRTLIDSTFIRPGFFFLFLRRRKQGRRAVGVFFSTVCPSNKIIHAERICCWPSGRGDLSATRGNYAQSHHALHSHLSAVLGIPTMAHI